MGILAFGIYLERDILEQIFNEQFLWLLNVRIQ